MTRFLVARQVGPDSYRTIAGLCDGYLEHTGVLLLNYYNTPEIVDKLLDLGDIHFLDKRLEHSPGYPPETIEDGVTIALERDHGDTPCKADILTLRQLDSSESWNEFVYIFTEDNCWKYFLPGQSIHGLQDLKDSVARVVSAVPPIPHLRYFDTQNNEIFAGMHIRFPEGNVERVYTIQDADGNPDLGLRASRPHGIPEEERGFYSLSDIILDGVEICEPTEDMAPTLTM